MNHFKLFIKYEEKEAGRTNNDTILYFSINAWLFKSKNMINMNL